MFRRLLAATLLATCLLVGEVISQDDATEPALPCISERVDTVIFLRIRKRTWHRIIFIKEGKVRATRLHMPDKMVWGVHGDDFVLTFNDYEQAEREIFFKEFVDLHLPENPWEDNSEPWWAMNRNMRDLKQP